VNCYGGVRDRPGIYLSNPRIVTLGPGRSRVPLPLYDNALTPVARAATLVDACHDHNLREVYAQAQRSYCAGGLLNGR
jgi:hypothetical protein